MAMPTPAWTPPIAPMSAPGGSYLNSLADAVMGTRGGGAASGDMSVGVATINAASVTINGGGAALAGLGGTTKPSGSQAAGALGALLPAFMRRQ
jgi:hypothetical protein